ncbi:MAG: hypothetical protein RL662_1619 [Bacteroidota bacterium]|jgi:hypothetical protein
MKKNRIHFTCLLAIAVFILSSCSSDDDKDTTKPLIENVEPHDGDTLKIGGKIHFEANLSDNDLLASYAIDIHDATGHTHTKSTSAIIDSVHFSFKKIWTDVAGKKNVTVHHHEIEIPVVDGAGKPIKEGKYHFIIQCLDQSGNQATLSRNVVLSHQGGDIDH